MFTDNQANGATSAGGAIQHGGGAVSSVGDSLSVARSVFDLNAATTGHGGALYVNSTLTITASVFSANATNNNGGALYHAGGAASIRASTFTQNTATLGGAIFNYTNTLNIANSTLAENSVTTNGSGIFNNTSAMLTVVNSTLSANASAGVGGGIRNLGNLTLRNTIIANSTSGGDCVTIITLVGFNHNNLIEDGANACGLTNNVDGNIIGSDPNLGTYAGYPAYLPLNAGSPAIDAGEDNNTCNNAPVNNQSQNGVTRPQDGDGDNTAVCDIGAYEADITPPSVVAITRADPNPTNSASVDFTVTFSESVTGMDIGDFSLTATGSLTGTNVTGVSGAGATYTVTVNTGTGEGTLRLDVPNTATITDLAGNPLIGLPYTGGEAYNVRSSFFLFLPLITKN